MKFQLIKLFLVITYFNNKTKYNLFTVVKFISCVYKDKYKLNKMFKCAEEGCFKSFSKGYTLNRHIMESHSEMSTLCEICGELFKNSRNLHYHQEKNHPSQGCSKQSYRNFHHHQEKNHPLQGCSNQRRISNNDDEVVQKRSKSCSANNVMNKNDLKDDKIYCETCKEWFFKRNNYHHLRSMVHRNNSCKALENDESVRVFETAFKCRIISYRITDKPNMHSELKD